MKRMRWDSGAYLKELERFQQLHGCSKEEAEKELYPIRWAKRKLKLAERIELKHTTNKFAHVVANDV